MPTIPVLQSLLGRPVFWTAVVVGLLLLVGLVGLLRRRGATRSAMVFAVVAFVAVVAQVLSLTLYGPDPDAPRRLFLDPMDGAWGWSSIAWRPVLDNVALFVPTGRVANTSDVLANATGAAVGVLLAVLAGARVAPSRTVSPPAPRR